MPELRVTLMVVGGIFLIALAWWELRRSRQVRGSDVPHPAPAPEPLARAPERSSEWDLPPLDLPRMSARDPEDELPVVEVGAADFAALEAHAETTAAALGEEELPPRDNGMDGLLAELGDKQVPDPPIGDEPWTAPAPVPVPALAAAPEPLPAPVAPVVVDWPAAQDGQVFAVRLVSLGEKFSGRAVR